MSYSTVLPALETRLVAGFVLLMLLLSLLFPTSGAAQSSVEKSVAEGQQWYPSDKGLFRVSYSSRLDPIAINRMHQWELDLQSSTGDAVDGAEIKINGGMPAHGHGLPTRPQVIALGDKGKYLLLEGLRFNMMGHWVIELTIERSGQIDHITIPLDL